MKVSPGSGNLLVGDRGPGGVAGPLLLELPAEDLLDVVHVEGADSRAGDAAERQTDLLCLMSIKEFRDRLSIELHVTETLHGTDVSAGSIYSREEVSKQNNSSLL